MRENHRGGADGGIDIKLETDGQVHLVQCKQWKSQKIGVSVVREMFGVMVSEGAASVFVITSGTFTKEAENFAAGKPIELIDGPGLAILIRDIRSILGKTPAQGTPYLAPGLGKTVPVRQASCPRCGSELVMRTARRGKSAGDQFLGCSSYPKCRYTAATWSTGLSMPAESLVRVAGP